MSEASGIVGAIIYETISLVLAAGEVRPVYGDTSYLTVLTATNAAQVAISFNGAAFFPLPTGIALSDFKAALFYVKNTDVSPNTVLVAKGEAALKDNRLIIDATNSLVTTVSNVVAQNLTQVGGVAIVGAGLAGMEAVGGPAAHSAASTGNPVRTAGRVNTAVDTTLVAGDVSDLFMTTSGALVNKPYAAPEVDWKYTAGTAGLAAAATTAMAAAAGAGIRNYCTALQITSGSTTALRVDLVDGATVVASFDIPANMVAPLIVPFPTPLQGTANTAFNVTLSAATTGGPLHVNAQGYKAA